MRARWIPLACGSSRPTTFSARGQLHAGMPRHLVFRNKETPEQLQTVLESVARAGVHLHQSVSELPPESLPAVIAALAAGSAATLVALHSMPLINLQDSPAVSLSAFTRLRTLDLRQTMESPTVLRAAQLPPSIAELTLTLGVTLDEICDEPGGIFAPTLVGFHSLHNLRRITLADYHNWQLGFADTTEEQHGAGICRRA